MEEVFDDGRLLIQMPVHQGNHYPLPRDSALLMIFEIETEMYAIPVKFQERIERDGFMFALLRRFGKIAPHQRRDCYRVSCSLPVSIERFWINEREIYPDRQPTEGQIINFSDGGMLFATNENIEKGEKLTLTFDTGNIENIEGMALRTKRIEGGKYQFRIAVQFRNKDKAQKRRFYKFVIDMQLEERRRWTQAINEIFAVGKKPDDNKQTETTPDYTASN